jgi:hypothetical protein
MASPAQIDANRANAQLSTGPTSIEGKAQVAQNATTHGLTSKHFVIRDDDREDFDALRTSLAAELDPQGAIENVTFNEILHAAWNLHRFRTIEAEVSLGTLDDFTDPQTTAVLDRLTRYQSRAQRAYYRALQELRTLQTNRALRMVKLDEEEDAAIPAITDINELTKQTQSEVTAKALELAIKMGDYETKTFERNFRSGHLAPQKS